MNTLQLRLHFLFSPRILLLLLLIGGGGFLLISLFGEAQVEGFPVGNPNLEPIEVMIKDRLAGRYSTLAFGWVLSTIVFFWSYIGRQLRRAERML